MNSCPSCHNPIEILDQHKGTLFNCPHCSAVYFVDWNGLPEAPQPEPHEPNVNEVSSDVPIESPSGDFFDPPIDVQAEAPFDSLNETQSEPQLQNDFNSAPSETETESPYDFNSRLDESPVDAPMINNNEADFSDVTDYANSNTLAGPLTYTLTIEGLDSNSLIAQLRESMTDSRFGWDVDGLLGSLKKDRLVLQGVSPAKASVLISRIKYLPLKISWRQDVLSGV